MLPLAVCLILTGFTGFSRPMTKEEAIELARKTLLKEPGIEAAEPELVSALAVRWPDRSLGCPDKDRMYLQVLTPGYRVVFRAGGRTYPVHVGGGEAVVCKAKMGKSKTAPEAKAVSAAVAASEMARRDLASRLKVAKEEIRVHFTKPVTWPDTRLGCPEEGKPYEKRKIKGYLIELLYEGTTYEVHADATGARLCRIR